MEEFNSNQENQEKSKICNHTPSDPNTSLIFANKKTMVNPEKVNAICSCCYKSFSFIKENGEYYRLE